MKYVKVTNILELDGTVNYKGLDISKFIPGSQVYPDPIEFCLVITTQESLPTHADIVELSEAEYLYEKQAVLDSLPKPFDAQGEVSKLQTENAELKQAVAELTLMLATTQQA